MTWSDISNAISSDLEDLAQDVVIVFLQLIEAPPARLIGGNRIRLDPIATSVLVEVDARINRFVDRGDIKAWDLLDAPRRRG